MSKENNNMNKNWIVAQLVWKRVKDSCPYPDKAELFVRVEKLEDILQGSNGIKPNLDQETINNGLNKLDAERGPYKSDDWTMAQVLMLLFWERGEEFGESFGFSAEMLKSWRKTATSARNGELWKTVETFYQYVRGGRQR